MCLQFFLNMKRIGLLSDTHSCWDEKYVTYFSGCDEIWHAGDIGDISIVERLERIAPLRAVSGNVDHGFVRQECPAMMKFKVEDVKVFMTHIGGYPGKYSPGIKKLLRENQINLFIDGHSHILKVIYDNELNLLHINPGAAGKQGWHNKRTIIRFVIDQEKIKDLEVIELVG